MNIKNDLHKRLSDIIKSAGTLAPFSIKGSVQPTIDYTKVMEKVSTETISSTAGNVAISISPGKGNKYSIIYGHFKLVTDATVDNRFPRIKILDKDDNWITGEITITTVPASTTDYMNIVPFNGEEDITFGGDALLGTNKFWIYEEDQLYWDIGSGKAGDAVTGALKIIETNVPMEA